MKDYYEILAVQRNASQEDIKRAFRMLALQYHPDRNPQDPVEAEQKFKEINDAYQVLSDGYRRQLYDLTGSVQAGVVFHRRGCGRGKGRTGQCRRWQKVPVHPY